jgi:cell division protein FtsL
MAVSSDHTAIGHSAVRTSLDLRAWLYVGVLLCLVISLAFVYLTQAGHVARQIEEMEDLELRLQRLKQENSALLLEIAQSEQVGRIKQRARELGFAEPEGVEYLVVQLDETTLPQEQTLPADPDNHDSVASALMAAASQGGWRQMLTGQFSDWMKVIAVP